MQLEDHAASRSTRGARMGRLVARVIRMVARTSQIATEPADLASALQSSHPAIIAMWHGQFMLIPVLSPKGVPVRTLVARHGDAEVVAQLLRAFGMEAIRGAGAGHRKRDRGGAHLLRAAITSLNEGYMVPMTADIPPGPARRAGLGIVTLARLSGRPIVPFAVASSRYLALNTWSRLTINLPFSRIGACLGAPIHVPRDATAEVLERCRLQVEASLDAATRAAYRLAEADPLRATPPAARARMGGPNPPPLDARLKLYRAVTRALQPVAPFILRRRAARGKEEPERLGERYGIASLARPRGPIVWMHAASVGETNAALPVMAGLAAMRPDLSFLLTTGTVTSARLAAGRLPPRALHQYVPLDAASYMDRFLEHWRPGLVILTESEVWPNLVLESAARHIPIALINGRMSKRSYRGWTRRRLAALPLFSRLGLVLAQNDRFADWFVDLGAPKVVACGNLKMDAPPPPVDALALSNLKEAIGDRTVFLAASTHPGEEVRVARLHASLRAEVPRLLTIIAPRHPERGAELVGQLAALGLKVQRRSRGELPRSDTDIYVADTIGELGTLFALAPVCLMGGSLVPHGGQNPVEAIKHGCGVVTGPYTSNFKDAYEALEAAKSVRRVQSDEEMQTVVGSLLQDEDALTQLRGRAEKAVQAMTGALARTLEGLEPLLPAREPAADTTDPAPLPDGGMARTAAFARSADSLSSPLPSLGPEAPHEPEVPLRPGMRHADP